MERTVNVAERQAARFGLSQQEVQSRRQWVQRTKQEVCLAGLASWPWDECRHAGRQAARQARPGCETDGRGQRHERDKLAGGCRALACVTRCSCRTTAVQELG